MIVSFRQIPSNHRKISRFLNGRPAATVVTNEKHGKSPFAIGHCGVKLSEFGR